MNKKLILLVIISFVLIQTVSAEGLSIQLKRTNPGIAQIKPAELICDIVNTDMTHKIEGFVWCKSPDDIKVSSTEGLASGSGAQYISPIFFMDEAPSQKAVYFTIESDYEGDFSTGCVFKYVPYKEVNGEILYQKMNLEYTSERTDNLFREIRLDKTVPFVSSDIEGDVYCRENYCLKDEVVINKPIQRSNTLWLIVGILAIITVILLAIFLKKK
jgi:hypothetical protein